MRTNNKSKSLSINRSILTEHSPIQPQSNKQLATNKSPHTHKENQIKQNLSSRFNKESFSINQGIKQNVFPQQITANRAKYVDVTFTAGDKRNRTNKVRELLESR